MSYDMHLADPVTQEPLHAATKHEMRGGTYCVGGTTELSLNITYNYSKHFYRLMGDNGIRAIYGKTGAESLPILHAAAAQLADDTHSDYWKATEGNAKRALLQLIALAQLRPDGVWEGD